MKIFHTQKTKQTANRTQQFVEINFDGQFGTKKKQTACRGHDKSLIHKHFWASYFVECDMIG